MRDIYLIAWGCLRKSGLVFELVSASIDALGFGGQALTLKSSGKLDLTTMAILEMSAESFGVFPLRTMRGRPVDHLQVMRKSVRQLSTAGLDPDNAQ